MDEGTLERIVESEIEMEMNNGHMTEGKLKRVKKKIKIVIAQMTGEELGSPR